MSFYDCNDVVYCIDCDDRITHVNDAWFKFAAENDSYWLVHNVIGTSFWQHICGESVSALIQRIITQTRDDAVSAKFPFRCDAPHRLREMELILEPLYGGGVRFETRILREIDRDPNPLFDRTYPRCHGTVDVCAWCRKVKTHDWIDPDLAARQHGWLLGYDVPSVRHCICDSCQEMVMERGVRSRLLAMSH